MKLNSLKLFQFKNYQTLEVAFSQGINCIIGKNGMGKTNLLDAIHYLSMTRSALNSIDQQNITHGEMYFAIQGRIGQGQREMAVNCYFEQGKKKVLKVNGKELEKLSDHIGDIPSVLITPDDTEIIKEGSEVRRKFFDSVIAQNDRYYLEDLMAMQRLLKQRNSFLKQNDGRRTIDKNLLSVYDESLMPLFERIGAKRKGFIKQFSPYFSRNYALIFEGKELPAIRYKTTVLDEDFKSHYSESLEKDILLQRTTMGAHKDDYAFILNNRPIRKFGSQGQQKSFIIALKLAEYDYLKESKGYSPLLLLDDIFDKLDDQRIAHLINLLTDPHRFSQIFITDARAERARECFSSVRDVRFYEISEGGIL